jgi:poly-gamma-glutamate capsule biosynthesis protein CapA/YwtB (metallophosphatase superfamily)
MGADCIDGHHPHVIHRCEKSDNFFKAYSLGNLFCIPSINSDPTASSYSAVLDLTVEMDTSGAKLGAASFRIMRSVEMIWEIPYTADTFDLYNATPSEDFKTRILYYAEKFAGNSVHYDKIHREYQIF